MENKTNPVVKTIVWKAAKVTLAFSLLGVLVLYTPIFELLYYFLYVVLIPVSVLALTGFVSYEVFELFELTAGELRHRIKSAREDIRAQATA